MLTLPPLPTTVRHLSDPEWKRLRRMRPGIWADPKTSCLTCAKKGTFLTAEGETECRCGDQWKLHLFLLNSGIGLQYQRLSWMDVQSQVPKPVINAVVDYDADAAKYVNAGFGMILRGTPGTGKTLLATLLLKRLLEHGYDGYFTQFNTLLDAYSAGWRDKGDREWFTRRVTNAGVLVIDDIGRENKGRENITNPLFDMVIRSRVADDKPTIITTNYSMDEIRSGYGGYVMSLLGESCLDYEVTGTDYRETALQQSLADLKAGIVRPVTFG